MSAARSISVASTLSPSLLLDLMRFEQEGQSSGVIEVLAACIRHARKLLIHLQAQDRVVPLTVFPLAEAADAHARLEAGKNIGKIILSVAR